MTTQQPPQPTPALSDDQLDVIAHGLMLAEKTMTPDLSMALWAEQNGPRLIAAARAYTALVPLVEAAAQYREAITHDECRAAADALIAAALESTRP